MIEKNKKNTSSTQLWLLQHWGYAQFVSLCETKWLFCSAFSSAIHESSHWAVWAREKLTWSHLFVWFSYWWVCGFVRTHQPYLFSACCSRTVELEGANHTGCSKGTFFIINSTCYIIKRRVYMRRRDYDGGIVEIVGMKMVGSGLFFFRDYFFPG